MTQPDPSALSGAPDTGVPSGAGVGDGVVTPPEAGAQSGAETPAVVAETVSKADFERVVTQLRAADQKRTKAETDLAQLRDKDLPEMDKLRRDAEAFKQEVDRLKETVRSNAVQMAFLKENSIKWRDASAALKLADMSEVVINDDGTVTGLKNAMEKLAKAMPFLVDDSTPAPNDNIANAGGVPPMNGRSGSQKPDTAGLASRIPALTSRRRPQRPS